MPRLPNEIAAAPRTVAVWAYVVQPVLHHPILYCKETCPWHIRQETEVALQITFMELINLHYSLA